MADKNTIYDTILVEPITGPDAADLSGAIYGFSDNGAIDCTIDGSGDYNRLYVHDERAEIVSDAASDSAKLNQFDLSEHEETGVVIELH